MALINVIKYSLNPNEMAWKYPNDSLKTLTNVIVNESQEVVFVKSGKVYDVLGPGKHVLSTANLPLLNKVINIPFGGNSPFLAEIWYINKLCVLDVKWGTSSPILIQDPKYKVAIPVTAYGQFGIKIKDSKVFLSKLVGTLKSFDQPTLVKYFRGLLVSNVKNVISQYFVIKNVSVLEINAFMSEISQKLEDLLNVELQKYGIELLNFYVTNIETSEEDSTVINLKNALSKRAEMDIVGYDYRTERSFDTLNAVANNTGSGSNVMNASIGLGMGFGLGGNIGNQMKNISSSMTVDSNDKIRCSNCNKEIDISLKFCPYCGNKVGIFCSKCGTKLSSLNLKYCPECGTKQKTDCPNCGQEVESNIKFCPNCGTKVSNQ